MFKAKILQDVHESELKKGDLVAVTGAVQAADSRPYLVAVQAADSRPYLVAVRLTDGVVGLVMDYQLVATHIVWQNGDVSIMNPGGES